MFDPLTLLLVHICLGLAATALLALAVVASIWAIDYTFKFTRAYAKILEWRRVYTRVQRRKNRPIPVPLEILEP